MEKEVKILEGLASIVTRSEESIGEDAHAMRQVLNVLESYSNYSPQEREEFREKLSMSSRQNLLIVSEKLAIEAIIEKNSELLKSAVLCHAIEDFRLDSRENILRLSIVWFAAKRMKLDGTPFFESSIELASDHGKDQLNEFLNREEYMKLPRAMGYEVKVKRKKVEIVEIIPAWAKNTGMD